MRGAVAEIRRLQALLARVYPHVHDTPGTEELQAELEREVMGITRSTDAPERS